MIDESPAGESAGAQPEGDPELQKDPLSSNAEGRVSPWIAALAALQFLTALPPLVRRPFTARELGASVAWFPLVGSLIGLLLALASALLSLIVPPPLRSGLVLALWVLVTGALHLDGFLDACDGLLGGGSPEKRLEIMRDERVGAYALAGGVLLLLLKFAALLSQPHRYPPLLLAPTLSRWCMSLAVVAFPYARKEGLGRAMKDNAGLLEGIAATVFTLAIAWVAERWIGLVLAAVSLCVAWLGALFALKRIPGLTGDVYGALNEVIECAVLVGWIVLNG